MKQYPTSRYKRDQRVASYVTLMHKKIYTFNSVYIYIFSESLSAPTMNGLSRKPFGYEYSRDSGELDVFEAAQYFSGDVDRLSFGIGRFAYGHAHTQKRHSLEIPPTTQQPPDHDHDHDQAVHSSQVANKKFKTSSTSPAAKLANYLNSLLLQITFKKKSKCMNNDYTFKYVHSHDATKFTEEPQHCDQVLMDQDNKKLSYNINNDVTWRCRRTKSIDDKKDWFFENKWVLNTSNGIGGKWSFERRDAGKVGLDDNDGEESDSSSDLFELRNIDVIDDAFLMSHDLPVCGTTLSD